jgi:predicted nicotinamide N-methyase
LLTTVVKIRGKLVLELGAGCGLVGIVASLLQAERVTLTDLQYTLDLMRGNAAKNQAALGTIDCRLCDWLKPPIVDESWAFNVLLVADCVWIEELVPPLLNTIRRFLESLSGKIQVVVSYQQRGKRAHDLFWEGMRNLFDSIEKVDITIEKPEHLNVYECTNK